MEQSDESGLGQPANPLNQQQPTQTGNQTQAPQPVTEQPPAISTIPQVIETPQKPKGRLYLLIVFILALILAGIGASFFLFQKTSNTQYVGYQTIKLTDATGGTLTATATRSIVLNNIFISVEANLSDPPEGSFYQAWLVDKEGDIFPTGRLDKVPRGVYKNVNALKIVEPFDDFKTVEELGYNTIVVSLEENDDIIMEQRILEGTFTQ